MGSGNHIPEELRSLDQWVAWKLPKIPIDPNTSHFASIRDPATWSAYETAAKAVDLLEACLGVGFAFSKEDPFTGVDLDHCRTPQTGEIEPWAMEIIRGLDSYTEVSLSGTGVHILIRAKVQGGGRRAGRIEAYSQHRFFVMTGQHLDGTPKTIEHRQEQFDSVFAGKFGQTKKPSIPRKIGREGHAQRPELLDADLIEVALSARNGEKFRRLFTGPWQDDYPSQSEADQALMNLLAFWTGKDAERMDRLFRQSGLMRPKWERREDYRNRTIANAIRLTTKA